MLLLGAILLAIFVLPFPWGIVAVVAGGLIDIAESVVVLKWSRPRRRRSAWPVSSGRRAPLTLSSPVKRYR